MFEKAVFVMAQTIQDCVLQYKVIANVLLWLPAMLALVMWYKDPVQNVSECLVLLKATLFSFIPKHLHACTCTYCPIFLFAYMRTVWFKRTRLNTESSYIVWLTAANSCAQTAHVRDLIFSFAVLVWINLKHLPDKFSRRSVDYIFIFPGNKL